jgi:hypothetical protein
MRHIASVVYPGYSVVQVLQPLGDPPHVTQGLFLF